MNPRIMLAIAAAVLVAVGALSVFLLMQPPKAPEPAQIAAQALTAPVIEAPAAVKLPESAPTNRAKD